MATPNQYTAPGTEYGGDEVSAIVLDPGYATTRAGFAGEDAPKSVVPSFFGTTSSGKLLFGDNAMHDTASEIEVRNVLNGGGAEDWVRDWDAASKLWEYSITSRLTGPRKSAVRSSADRNDDGDVEMADGAEDMDDEEERNPFAAHPLLMSEPGKSSTKTREKIIEIAMENWEVPAFYLSKTGVLASFSQGRPTALVIDVGASMISVTPVVDGMVLKKGIRTSPLGGNFISQQVRLFFEQSNPPIPLVPHYMVAAKIPVEAGQPSQATYKQFKKPPTDSFRAWQEDRVIHDFKESVVELWPGPGRLSDNVAAQTENQPLKSYEMPDGWNNLFNIQDRRKIAEGLFAHQAALTDATHPAPKLEHTVPDLIQSALNGVDADVRPHLLMNVVVIGGASFQRNFTRRLDAELKALYPGPNVRLAAPSQYTERAFASWVGGSILASLGSFHQLWISRKEYDEHGPSIVEKRSK